MSKVGLTVLKPEWESPLSEHFGMAGWILIYDAETQQKTFERNRLLYGGAVIEAFERHGCTDAIFSHIGPGALEMLKGAGIRGWYGPGSVPVPQVVEQFLKGELMPAEEAESRGAEHHPSRKGRSASENRRGEQETHSPAQT